MSEHMCCITRRLLTKKQVAACRAVAKANGYSFVYTKPPGTGWQGWFSGPNRGSPFDGASAQAIRDGLSAAGLGALFT